MLKNAKAIVLMCALVGSLLTLGTVLPASASGTARAITLTDATGDAEFSTQCQFDDRGTSEYSPFDQIPSTNQQAVNCDNYVAETDLTTFSLEYVPASNSDALFTPAGNDGIWSTADDVTAPAGAAPGTNIACVGTTNNPPGCATFKPVSTKRTGTIKATWNFAKAWPAPDAPALVNLDGNKNDELVGSLDARTLFRNRDIQNNTLAPSCDRAEKARVEWTGVNPAVSTNDPVNGDFPAYVFDPRGALHAADGTNFLVAASWSGNGLENGTRADQRRWRPKLTFGYYDPTIDNDINYMDDPTLNPVYNPWNTGATGANPWTGLGIFYDFQFNADRTTLTVKFPSTYVTVSDSCLKPAGNASQAYKKPYWFDPYARTASEKVGSDAIRSIRTGNPLRPGNGQNDVLDDITAVVGIKVNPQLPVPIPTGSLVCASVCPTWDSTITPLCPALPLVGNPCSYPLTRQNIDWVISGTLTSDQYDVGGVNQISGSANGLPPSLGPGTWPGPTCSSPTFGGQLPRNPFWNQGNACAIRNPYNIGLRPAPARHIHVY